MENFGTMEMTASDESYDNSLYETEKSNVNITLIVVIAVCAILGIILGIVLGRRAANK